MIVLRPQEKKDDSFIESVYRSTREAELKITNWPEPLRAAFITMQSTAQLTDYRAVFPDAAFQVIVYKKQDAGRWYTHERDEEIRLIDITLLPEFRGKGIGAFLLGELIKKADGAQKKISLHVDPANRALQLYLHVGFKHIKNNGRLYYMERKPESK